jgi:hypothetical protein
MSDVIYTAADGRQYKAVPDGPNKYPCVDCALRDSSDCRSSADTLSCIAADIIWQPITIQKTSDNLHQWLEKNAEMFRPIFERMGGNR